MIHFDFVVTDADAENIMAAMQGEINRMNVAIMEELIRDNDEVVHNLRESIKYFEDLKLKMLNTRVEDDKSNISS